MTFSKNLRAQIDNAKSICMLTGAGISAESGLATFRGTDGLWSKLKPEELANFDAFMRNPEMVWEWYAYRKKIIHEVKPNAAHYALARMEACMPGCTLVTQNIDNLHFRAGSKNVFELHGNIERSYCIDCRETVDDVEVTREKPVPKCPVCGGLIRPDVVWFGEMLPEGIFESASRAAETCDLFFTIGTSAVVYPAAGLPMTARNAGAYVVEVNTEPTELSRIVNETLAGKAGEIMPHIADELEKAQGTAHER